jgi:hypothetical protein
MRIDWERNELRGTPAEIHQWRYVLAALNGTGRLINNHGDVIFAALLGAFCLYDLSRGSYATALITAMCFGMRAERSTHRRSRFGGAL